MRKHWLAGSSVTLLLFACASAPVNDGRDSAESTVGNEPTVLCMPGDSDGTVRIWHSMGGNASLDIWSDLVADFTKTHSVRIELRRFDGDSQTIAELARTPLSDWPDIVLVSEQATRTLLDSNRFLRPADCENSPGSDLLPLVRATYTVDGELVAMPFGVSVPVLIFDAAEFRKAGLDPTRPPSTLTDLLAASAAIRDSKASPYGLVMPDWCGNFVVEQYSAKQGVPEGAPDNGHRARQMTVDFATADNIAALIELRDGVRDGHVRYIGPNPSNFDDLVAIVSDVNGATMAIHTSGALGDVIRLLEAGNFAGVELGVGQMPGPGIGSLVGGNALWLVNPDDSDRAGRAWTVVDWLEQPEQLARLAAATGYVPATNAAAEEPVLLDRWNKYPQLKVPYDQLKATPVADATAGIVIGPFNERAFVLFGMCSQIMDDEVDPAQALATASELVNQLLDEYEAQQSGGVPAGSTTTTTAHSRSATGTITCASGAAVVGAWVELEKGGSGWAELSEVGEGVATYKFDVPPGAQYQLHVGCGGTADAWGSSNFTAFVDGADNSFRCFDEPGVSAGKCTRE